MSKSPDKNRDFRIPSSGPSRSAPPGNCSRSQSRKGGLSQSRMSCISGKQRRRRGGYDGASSRNSDANNNLDKWKLYATAYINNDYNLDEFEPKEKWQDYVNSVISDQHFLLMAEKSIPEEEMRHKNYLREDDDVRRKKGTKKNVEWKERKTNDKEMGDEVEETVEVEVDEEAETTNDNEIKEVDDVIEQLIKEEEHGLIGKEDAEGITEIDNKTDEEVSLEEMMKEAEELVETNNADEDVKTNIDDDIKEVDTAIEEMIQEAENEPPETETSEDNEVSEMVEEVEEEQEANIDIANDKSEDDHVENEEEDEGGGENDVANEQDTASTALEDDGEETPTDETPTGSAGTYVEDDKPKKPPGKPIDEKILNELAEDILDKHEKDEKQKAEDREKVDELIKDLALEKD